MNAGRHIPNSKRCNGHTVAAKEHWDTAQQEARYAKQRTYKGNKRAQAKDNSALPARLQVLDFRVTSLGYIANHEHNLSIEKSLRRSDDRTSKAKTSRCMTFSHIWQATRTTKYKCPTRTCDGQHGTRWFTERNKVTVT